MKKALEYDVLIAEYDRLVADRSEFENVWIQLSNYLVPGRGIYSRFTKPSKRHITAPRVLNNTGEEALYVLTSGMHGALTSPSRPWFRLEWANPQFNEVEFLKAWLQESDEILKTALQTSNFYPIIDSFYTEYCAFGTASMYVGEDSQEAGIPFRFELLTAGEYAFAFNSGHLLDKFYRTIFMTPRQLVQKFGNKVSKTMRDQVEAGVPSVDSSWVTVLEVVAPETYQDKPYTQIFYAVAMDQTSSTAVTDPSKPLGQYGFYEMPYMAGRWSTIGSDIYGIGPGERALSDIRRLQEMEKAFLMATHKSINPPLNAPARMKGKLNTLPGGMNYYTNPAERVDEVYRVNLNFQAALEAIDRVEQRIKRNFFNDIFLIPGRGPDRSPLKATEVTAREQEKMLRLGPVVERLQHEFLQPLIQRCFSILNRSGALPQMPPEYMDMVAQSGFGFTVVLISPMATAQRSVAIQGINSFMAFIANTAQFDQTILDNIDVDEAAREVADITGVELGVLRPEESVAQIRQQRAKAVAEEKAKQEQMQQVALQADLQKQTAETRKTAAEAGQTMMDTTTQGMETGLI